MLVAVSTVVTFGTSTSNLAPSFTKMLRRKTVPEWPGSAAISSVQPAAP